MENPKERIWDTIRTQDVLLPEYAARYCGETKNRQAVNAYRKWIREHDPKQFRVELGAFIAECESGEEPKSRGRAFNARLKGKG